MRSILKNGFVAAMGMISAIYLVNPTAGLFELLPDNLPVVGNLDEATATAILLASLAHFGFDFRDLFRRFGFRPKPTVVDIEPVRRQ